MYINYNHPIGKVIFEWDDNKNDLNEEKRYYCFGKVEDEAMTVRFTYRGYSIRIIGAGYWRKGKKFMKKTQKDKIHR